jgi:hypothetical protein
MRFCGHYQLWPDFQSSTLILNQDVLKYNKIYSVWKEMDEFIVTIPGAT